MKPLKRTFYPEPEVEKVLRRVGPKKLSQRVNDLIFKGLAKEEEEAIRADYERYDRELAAAPPRKKNARGVSEFMMAAEPLFETDGSDEDLF